MQLWIASAFAICAGFATPAYAADEAVLLQYQYSQEAGTCDINLNNGIKIQFASVFAHVTGQTVLEDIAIFVVPTEQKFEFNSIVDIAYYNKRWPAKAVKFTKGIAYFATSMVVLEKFWASGMDTNFQIIRRHGESGAGAVAFALPDHGRLNARNAISKGVTCIEEARAAD